MHNIRQIVSMEDRIVALKGIVCNGEDGAGELILDAKKYGFSDRRLAYLLGMKEDAVRKMRYDLGIRPVYKRVDTCGAEFEAFTPYLYSTYEDECSYNFV